MTLMTANNHNQQGKDYRAQPRWSAGKKTDAVSQLLHGEPLADLSRELKVEVHRLATWHDDFLAAGEQGAGSWPWRGRPRSKPDRGHGGRIQSRLTTLGVPRVRGPPTRAHRDCVAAVKGAAP